MDQPSRYVPDIPFPEYSYVPGYRPHPKRDPEGHSYRETDETPSPLDPCSWKDSRAYLFGIDLFNYGYYWEAHEEWEGLWHAAGREGPVADLLRGLIKLTAAGVKVRAGNSRGIKRHAEKGVTIFEQLREDRENDRFAGLSLSDLIQFTQYIQREEPRLTGNPEEEAEVVFDRFLIVSCDPDQTGNEATG